MRKVAQRCGTLGVVTTHLHEQVGGQQREHKGQPEWGRWAWPQLRTEHKARCHPRTHCPDQGRGPGTTCQASISSCVSPSQACTSSCSTELSFPRPHLPPLPPPLPWRNRATPRGPGPRPSCLIAQRPHVDFKAKTPPATPASGQEGGSGAGPSKRLSEMQAWALREGRAGGRA